MLHLQVTRSDTQDGPSLITREKVSRWCLSLEGSCWTPSPRRSQGGLGTTSRVTQSPVSTFRGPCSPLWCWAKSGESGVSAHICPSAPRVCKGAEFWYKVHRGQQDPLLSPGSWSRLGTVLSWLLVVSGPHCLPLEEGQVPTALSAGAHGGCGGYSCAGLNDSGIWPTG